MAARIRVLTAISGLAIGEPLGGAERFGVELALSLDRNLFEPAICALWRYDVPSEIFWVKRLAQEGIEVFFAADWGHSRSVTHYAGALRNIARHFQHAPVDIVHSHLPLAGLSALLLRRQLGARALVRTALAGKEWGDGLTAVACRQVFTNWVFPLTFDAEACVSQAQTDRFNRRPGARLRGRKTLLMHNAIRLDRFAAGPDPTASSNRRSEFGLNANHLVVGSVGRLSREKGSSVLVDAAALVTDHCPDVRFVVVGDGPLRNELEAQIKRLALGDRIILTGARTDVDSIYGIMDLFVLPSFWEGLPTVILESMACGVPVVATDIPGTRELVTANRTGWLTPPGDSAGLAETIVAALDHRGTSSPGRRSAPEVVPRFSIEKVAREYETLYLGLLKRTA